MTACGTPKPTSSVSAQGERSRDKLDRILTMAGDLLEQCRVCWVRRQVTQPHPTHRCRSRVCSGEEWKRFKSSLRFPPGIICFFCLATYGPPFNHEKPADGEASGDLCDYPDVLKELLYIIFKEERVRTATSERLGTEAPNTVLSYKRFIGKRQVGGLLGLYEVLGAYLELRETGAFD